MIFENQDVISSENVYQKVIDFAVRAGLDKEAFKVCLALPDAKAAIQADVDEGKAVQISSTPTVFVNGRPVIGGDENTLEQYIQFELGPEEAKKPATSVKPAWHRPRLNEEIAGWTGQRDGKSHDDERRRRGYQTKALENFDCQVARF